MLAFDLTITPAAIGIWTLVGGAIAWAVEQWRQNRTLSADDRLAKQMGFQKQAESLLKENRLLREEVSDTNARLDEFRKVCHAENDQLRRHIWRLEDELVGYKRQDAQMAASRVRLDGDSLDIKGAQA